MFPSLIASLYFFFMFIYKIEVLLMAQTSVYRLLLPSLPMHRRPLNRALRERRRASPQIPHTLPSHLLLAPRRASHLAHLQLAHKVYGYNFCALPCLYQACVLFILFFHKHELNCLFTPHLYIVKYTQPQLTCIHYSF